jgi:hypothetical protein
VPDAGEAALRMTPLGTGVVDNDSDRTTSPAIVMGEMTISSLTTR